jgi:hypothetical protein
MIGKARFQACGHIMIPTLISFHRAGQLACLHLWTNDMFDIYHEWGGDLAVGYGGDIALVTASQTTSQRIGRRLLTNPGDYIWNLDYGGGLALFVGSPVPTSKIEAVVRTQLALESTVAVTPAPQVSVLLVDAANAYVVANITYADQSSSLPVKINVTSA